MMVRKVTGGMSGCVVYGMRHLVSLYYNNLYFSLLYDVTYWEVSPSHIMCPLLLTKGGQSYLCILGRAGQLLQCLGCRTAGSPGALTHHVIPSPLPIRGVIGLWPYKVMPWSSNVIGHYSLSLYNIPPSQTKPNQRRSLWYACESRKVILCRVSNDVTC